MQEMFKKGILVLSTHNVTLSHSDSDLQRIKDVYREVLESMKTYIDDSSLKSRLQAEPLEALFNIRQTGN